ncbi:MAG: FecR domain-containing protein [Flavobacteriaceae bacterium]
MWFRGFAGLAILVAALAGASAPALAEIATAVDVLDSASVTTGSGTRALATGGRVSVGDTVETSRGGQVQLLFDDNTKVVVGPNSRLLVDTVLMRSGNTASRFAVTAVSGSFRFITGNSPKSAYDIRTRTATVGIRGTIFDIAVGWWSTDLVLLSGVISFCNMSGACEQVSGNCTLVVANRAGFVGSPSSQRETDRRFGIGFPYLLSQDSLLDPFRADISSCSNSSQSQGILNGSTSIAPGHPSRAPSIQGPGRDSYGGGEGEGEGGGEF